MNPYVRLGLIILAASTAAFAAADPVGVPTWTQAVVAAVAAGLAGAGIIPPQVPIFPVEHDGGDPAPDDAPKTVAFRRTGDGWKN